MILFSLKTFRRVFQICRFNTYFHAKFCCINLITSFEKGGREQRRALRAGGFFKIRNSFQYKMFYTIDLRNIVKISNGNICVANNSVLKSLGDVLKKIHREIENSDT